MNKKKILLFLCFLMLFSTVPSEGQHQPVISQYMLNKFLFNPGLTGLKDQVTITAGHRKQWTAIEGAPNNYYLTGHAPIGGEGRESHMGLGGTLFTDKIGPLRTSLVSVSGAYHTPISEAWHLSAGLALGVLQRHLNRMAFDPVILHDPALEAGIPNQYQPFVSLGLWAFSPHAYMGLSSIQAPAYDVHSGLNNHWVNARHYFFNTGFLIRLKNISMSSPTEKDLLIIPSALVRYLPHMPIVYDFNMRVVYANIMMLGVSYRNSKDVVVQFGIQFHPKKKGYDNQKGPGYFFAYSYDAGFATLGQVSGGAHEVTVGIHIFQQRVECPLIKKVPIFFF